MAKRINPDQMKNKNKNKKSIKEKGEKNFRYSPFKKRIEIKIRLKKRKKIRGILNCFIFFWAEKMRKKKISRIRKRAKRMANLNHWNWSRKNGFWKKNRERERKRERKEREKKWKIFTILFSKSFLYQLSYPF